MFIFKLLTRRSNYDILGVPYDSTDEIVREKFREQVLLHHSDRGGDDEKFLIIKTAYEELKLGKKYPNSFSQNTLNTKFYDLDEEEQRRHNLILASNVAKDIQVAQKWVEDLILHGCVDKRLFGSSELGEIEMEIQANKTLFIRGKYWAGNFEYDGTILMRGSITSPYFLPYADFKTKIIVKNGNFILHNPLANNYTVESGSIIIANNGDIQVGDVTGRKESLPDPNGRVGVTILCEHFTQLYAPNGKIIAGDVCETVILEGDEIILQNLSDNVRIRGKKILIYGAKVTHDVEITLLDYGMIRFYDKGSGFDISDDAILKLENGKKFRLRDLKVRKFISYGGNDITFEYLNELK